jgi:aconitase A
MYNFNVIIDIRDVPTLYINLDSERERNKKTHSLLEKNNFKNFKRFRAVDQGEGIGITKSHLKILQEVVRKNDYPILILEDDIETRIENFKIDVPNSSDAIYLGLSQYGIGENGKDEKNIKISNLSANTHKVHNMLARHAVLHLNRNYDIRLIEQNKKFLLNPQNYPAGDVLVAQIAKEYNVYALNEPIFYQNDPKTLEYTNKSIYEMIHRQVF